MGIEKKKGEGPVFDYSSYSHKDQREGHQLRIRLQRAGQQVDDADPTMPEDEFEALLARYTKLLSDIEFNMSKWIVSVPREWLMPDAPIKIDWTKPNALDWVREMHMDALREASAEARSPEGISGN